MECAARALRNAGGTSIVCEFCEQTLVFSATANSEFRRQCARRNFLIAVCLASTVEGFQVTRSSGRVLTNPRFIHLCIAASGSAHTLRESRAELDAHFDDWMDIFDRRMRARADA